MDYEIVSNPRHRAKGSKLASKRSLGTKPTKIPSKKKTGLKWKKSTLAKADAIFSNKIRARDKHCQYPDCRSTVKLQCSHYIGRATKSTRFYDDNCIALCWFHHYKSKDLGYEYQKQRKEKHGYDGQYTIFMKKWLGEERWNRLLELSEVRMKPREIREMVWGIIETK